MCCQQLELLMSLRGKATYFLAFYGPYALQSLMNGFDNKQANYKGFAIRHQSSIWWKYKWKYTRSSYQQKDLGIVISSDLKCSQQCLYAYSKANRVLGMIRRPIINKKLRIMLSLYKTLIRPHVEYCSTVWSPLYETRVDRKNST